MKKSPRFNQNQIDVVNFIEANRNLSHLVLCRTIYQVEDIFESLVAKGHEVEALTAATSGGNRNGLIDKFNRSEIKILVGTADFIASLLLSFLSRTTAVSGVGAIRGDTLKKVQLLLRNRPHLIQGPFETQRPNAEPEAGAETEAKRAVLPNWANWTAQDADGCVWAYAKKPEADPDDGYWYSSPNDLISSEKISNGEPNPHWTDSLKQAEREPQTDTTGGEDKPEFDLLSQVAKVPSWAKWVAQDKDGSIWVYAEKPMIRNSRSMHWSDNSQGGLEPEQIGYTEANPNWASSLKRIERKAPMMQERVLSDELDRDDEEEDEVLPPNEPKADDTIPAWARWQATTSTGRLYYFENKPMPMPESLLGSWGVIEGHFKFAGKVSAPESWEQTLVELNVEPRQSEAVGHPHAENMKLYAEDATKTQEPWKLWEEQGDDGNWFQCYDNPTWYKEAYRRRDSKIVVNGIEVPTPIRSEPELGAEVYCVRLDRIGLQSKVKYHPLAKYLLTRGLLHATEADARAHANAILKVGV